MTRWRKTLGRVRGDGTLGPAAYACALGLAGIALLACRPILPVDTDLWYHLNGGRFIWEHGALPRDTFFSFLTPPRPYVDYYWLFQAGVYALFSNFGYVALVLLRASAFAAASGLLLAWLLPARGGESPASYRAFLFALTAMCLLPRFATVRPHLFTYLSIVFYLFVLEAKPRLAWALPAAGLLWGNLHGVSYPIAVCIPAAYLAEYFIGRIRGEAYERDKARSFVAPLGLAAAAALLTPNGLQLLGVPFKSLEYASRSIVELRSLRILDFGSPALSAGVPSWPTLYALVLAAGALAALAGLLERKLRPAHLLLWLAGVALSIKGYRFACETALLSLPLLAAHPLWKERGAGRVHPAVSAALALAAMAVPVRVLWSSVPAGCAWPFCGEGLPLGVTRYLSGGAGGMILAEPLASGYLEWSLGPRYRILTDMQTPFVFTDFDSYTSLRAFAGGFEMGRLLDRFGPEYVLAPYQEALCRSLESKGRYAPVLFDEAGILYARQEGSPVPPRDVLKALDPAAAAADPAKWAAEAKRPSQALDEARRVAALAGGPALELAARLESRLGEGAAAVADAEALSAQEPDRARPQVLLGDVLIANGRAADASAAFRRAVRLAQGEERADALKKLGRAYLALGDWKGAFRCLREAVDVWQAPSPQDVADLIRAATLAGRPSDARAALAWAESRGWTDPAKPR